LLGNREGVKLSGIESRSQMAGKTNSGFPLSKPRFAMLARGYAEREQKGPGTTALYSLRLKKGKGWGGGSGRGSKIHISITHFCKDAGRERGRKTVMAG